MSKQSFVNGDGLDFSILRTVVRDNVLSLFQEIEGSKCIAFDKTMSRSMNIILEGASIFKGNTIVKVTKLTEESIETDAEVVIFMCKGEVETLELVVNAITDLRGKRSNMKFHLLLIPRKTQLSIDFLRKQKVLPLVQIHELDIDLIPIDNDLLSFEHKTAFLDLYLRDDETILKTIAETLLKLEVLYGPFKQMDAFGDLSGSILDLIEELKPSSIQSKDSKINRVILLDRSVDLASLFVTPLTYEGLIHKFLHFDCGILAIEGNAVGKPDDTPVSIPLNSNDSLFSEIANLNISVVPRYLKDKSSEIQALYNSRPKDTNCSINEMNQFVKKVGTIQELSESLNIHLGIADQLLGFTNSPGFGQQWQVERELLEGGNAVETLREMLHDDIELEVILHYFVLYSIVNNGVRGRDLEVVRNEILYKFGFQYMPLFAWLEKLQLLKRRENNGNYSNIKSKLKLIRSDVDGTKPKDINYVTSGYAPISARMVQTVLFETMALHDLAKEQEVTIDPKNNMTLIVFVGGVTFLEVTAIRLLKLLKPSVKFVILTTNIMKGDTIIKEFSKKCKIDEKIIETPPPPPPPTEEEQAPTENTEETA